MYIKRLEIIGNEGTIRKIEFNEFVNIITTPKNDEQGNSVGKSTVIDLIDICLGARYESKIKRFSDTLLKIINEKQVKISLTLVSDAEETKIEVGLCEKTYKINGQKKRPKEFGEEVRDLLFEEVPKNLAVRKFVPRFLIIELPVDESRVIRFLDFNSGTQNEMLGVYEAVYAYFLNSEKFRNNPKPIMELMNERNKQFAAENNPRSVKIGEAINILENSAKSIKGYTEHNSDVRKYQSLIDLSQSLQIEREILANEISKSTFTVDDEIVQLLTQELSGVVPDADSAFKKILNFNNARERNRKAYLEEQEQKVEEKISKNNYELNLVRSELSQYMNFKEEKSFDFDSYNQLLKKSFKMSLDDKIQREQEIKISDDDLKELFPTESIENFNSKLKEISLKIIGNEYEIIRSESLSPNKRAVPIEFASNQGSSSGRLHQLAFAFVAAIIAINKTRNFPNFILQDINEVTDEEPFENMFDIALQNGIQFIAPILSSKLSPDLLKKYPPILELSNDDKLFEPKETYNG